MSETLEPGTTIDQRYELRQRLIETPAYIEYRAFDREVEVDVSLWQMHLALFPQDTYREQLLLNAHGLRSLVHPHLRRIFGAGEANGILYVTWQLATPFTMKDVAQNEPEPLVALFEALVSGLDEAHNAGYIHGRLAPVDLVQVAGQIKIGGIGLLHGMDALEATKRWKEYRQFVALEVDAGKLPTAAADIYSVAMLIRYFAGATEASPFGVLQNTHGQLTALLEAAGAKLPEGRPSAREMLQHFKRAPSRAQTSPAKTISKATTDSPKAISNSQTQDGIALFAEVGPGELETSGAGHSHITERELDRPLEAAMPVYEQALEEATTSPTRILPLEKRHARGAHDDIDVPTVPGYSRMLNDIGLQPEPSEVVLAETQWTRNRDSDIPDQAEPTDVDPDPPVGATPSEAPSTSSGVSPEPQFASGAGSDAKPSRPKGIAAQVPSTRKAALTEPVSVPLTHSGDVRNRSSRSIWLLAAVPIVILGGAVGVWVAKAAPSALPKISQLIALDAGTQTVSPKPPEIVVTAASHATGVCPPNMVLVGGKAGFCIDAYEAPGKGRQPEAGIRLDEARASCQARNVRLCTTAEWEQACGGPQATDWPYGDTYRKDVCNLASRRDVAVAGSYPQCKSAVGAYDMSGNVAEWVEEGVIKGGFVRQRKRHGSCFLSRQPSAKRIENVGYRCCMSLKKEKAQP